jgi:hypothetical protein
VLQIVWAILSLASLAVVWAPAHLPFTDLGQHLSATAIWHYYHHPDWDFQRYYTLQLGANPYWAVYALMHALAYVCGLEAAARIVISLYVLGLPAAMALLARRFGGSKWVGLFGFPLAFNFNLQWGFLNYCLGLVAVLLALAAFDWFCEKPTWRRGLLAALSGGAVYFFHILPWGLYLACAGLIGLLHEKLTKRSLFLRLAVWSSSLVVGGAVTLFGKTYHMGSVKLALKFYPIRHHAGELANYLWHACASGVDDMIGLLLLAMWAILFLGARREKLRLHDLRAVACVLTAITAYLVLPRSVLTPVYWWGINVRFAAAIGIFLALTVRGELVGWRRLAMLPVAALSLILLGDYFVHYRRADAFAAGYDKLCKIPEQKSRVMVIVFPPWNDPTWRYQYMRNYYGFYQAERGGYAPWDFDNEFPFVYRQRFPAPDWSRPTFRWEQQARYWDYVLAFQPPPNLMAGHSPTVAGSDGKWILWKLPGPRVDEPPGPAYPWDWAYDAGWKPPN